jgi:hypothetical protein
VGEADHPSVLDRDEQHIACRERRVPAQLRAVDVHRLEMGAEDRLISLAIGLDVEQRHRRCLVRFHWADHDIGCGGMSRHR